jgi:hypothetical protein
MYRDYYPESRYSEFLGVGEVVRVKRCCQRPVVVVFRDCSDGKPRRRSFSAKNVTLVEAREQTHADPS